MSKSLEKAINERYFYEIAVDETSRVDLVMYAITGSEVYKKGFQDVLAYLEPYFHLRNQFGADKIGFTEEGELVFIFADKIVTIQQLLTIEELLTHSDIVLRQLGAIYVGKYSYHAKALRICTEDGMILWERDPQ